MLTGARILLTGATGRLGRCLAAELVRNGFELVLVVRASSPDSARERARTSLPPGTDLERVTALCGDVTEPGLGLRLRERARLRASLDVVLHAAASTSFSTPLDEARSTNVVATRNVLAFAERLSGLTRLAHVSTAFVAGKRTGRIFEHELEHDCGFQNAYQQSKHEAELLVRNHRDVLPIRVFRPSIVLDGVDNGGQQTRSAFRFALELVKKGLLPALPGSGSTPVDLVTENDAARAIVALLAGRGDADTYHIAGGERAPTLGSIVDPLREVRYLDVERYAWEVAKWRHERPRFAGLYDELESFIYELAYPKIFDTACAEAVLGGPVTHQDSLASLLGEAVPHADRARVGARA